MTKKILALDLSNKTGYAVLLGENVLQTQGTFTEALDLKPPKEIEGLLPEFFYIHRSFFIAQFITNLVRSYTPDYIYIEQTNGGRFRVSQKQLEFLHFAVLKTLQDMGKADIVRYVDTSRWRGNLNIRLSKDQKKHNKDVRGKKIRGKITPKHLAVWYVNEKFGLELKIKDNDAADAICMALYGQSHSSKPLFDEEINLDEALFKDDKDGKE